MNAYLRNGEKMKEIEFSNWGRIEYMNNIEEVLV